MGFGLICPFMQKILLLGQFALVLVISCCVYTSEAQIFTASSETKVAVHEKNVLKISATNKQSKRQVIAEFNASDGLDENQTYYDDYEWDWENVSNWGNFSDWDDFFVGDWWGNFSEWDSWEDFGNFSGYEWNATDENITDSFNDFTSYFRALDSNKGSFIHIAFTT